MRQSTPEDDLRRRSAARQLPPMTAGCLVLGGLMFGRLGSTGCEFRYYKSIDPFADGTPEPNPAINCEGGNGSLSSGDYLDEICPTPHSYTGVEYDWLRFFWDLHTDSDSEIAFTSLAVIFDMAQLDTWNDEGTGPVAHHAVPRLDWAADQGLSNPLLDEWFEEQEDNGVEH